MRTLPPGWAEVRVRDVLAARPSNGRSVPTATGGFPVLRLTALRDGRVDLCERKIGAWTADQAASYLVREGDVLLSRGNGSIKLVGRAALLVEEPDPIAYPDTMIRLKPDSAILHSGYLVAIWNSAVVRRQIEAAARTTAGIYKINQTIVENIVIPLPPLSEQERIAVAVTEYCETLKAAERTLAGLGPRTAKFHSALLRQVRELALSDGAELREIGSIAETSLGKMLDSRRANGKPTPYLRNVNVRWGNIDTSDLKSVLLQPEERERFNLRRGDVLVCEGGEPGRCAIWEADDSEICYQKALHRIRTSDQVLPEWLRLMLTEAVINHRADRLFTGTTIKHLPQQQLRRIEIPVPSIPIQRELLNHAQGGIEASSRMRTAAAAALARTHALTQKVLDAAFRGELMDQDPADEPADTGLARVGATRTPGMQSTGRKRIRKAALA